LSSFEDGGRSGGVPSGESEVKLVALVSPHLSPLPSCALLLVGEASKRVFEAHRRSAMVPPSYPCRALSLGNRGGHESCRGVRVDLLDRLEVVGGSLVVGNGEAEYFRRALVVGYGGRRPEGRKKPCSLSLFCWERFRPSDLGSTVEIRTYPFAGKIHKETLSFLVINPRSVA
jgi:hypothetical protein